MYNYYTYKQFLYDNNPCIECVCVCGVLHMYESSSWTYAMRTPAWSQYFIITSL